MSERAPNSPCDTDQLSELSPSFVISLCTIAQKFPNDVEVFNKLAAALAPHHSQIIDLINRDQDPFEEAIASLEKYGNNIRVETIIKLILDTVDSRPASTRNQMVTSDVAEIFAEEADATRARISSIGVFSELDHQGLFPGKEPSTKPGLDIYDMTASPRRAHELTATGLHHEIETPLQQREKVEVS